jgi:hypothetical protein
VTKFWRSSGYHPLTADGTGRLIVTDDLLRAYWLRPEVAPVEQSCAAEMALHDEPETWVGHFTGAAVAIQPMQRIDDRRWIWHVGLDTEASALLNDLYRGEKLDEARRAVCSRRCGSSPATRRTCLGGCAVGQFTSRSR